MMPNSLELVSNAVPAAGSSTHPRSYKAKRFLFAGAITLFLLLGGFGGWAYLSSISAAVIAQGAIATANRNQVIEHTAGGAVKAVYVKNGQKVQAGDILLELDGALLEVEKRIVESKLWRTALMRDRLQAETTGERTIPWSPEVLEYAQTHAAGHEGVLHQDRIFAARLKTLEDSVAQLHEQIGQIERLILGLQAQSAAAERKRGIVRKQIQLQEALYAKKAVGVWEGLILQKELADVDGMIGEHAASIALEQSRIAELELQIIQLRTTRLHEAENKAAAVTAARFEVQQDLLRIYEELQSLTIRTPITGVVHDMTVMAAHEVVKAAEPIARVVPDTGNLIAVVHLDTTDVDEVQTGQDVVLSFPAFPMREAFDRRGKVMKVSADALVDKAERRNFYEVEVEIGDPIVTSDRAANLAAFEVQPLIPGMPVTAFITTGAHSPLNYLVEPAAVYFRRALRDS